MEDLVNTECDFMMERELKRRNPDLFKRFQDSVFVLNRMLSGYQHFFPNFTDHTELHSLNVIDYCNHVIGPENCKKLNDDEIYCLLMGCYLHDVGMGIAESDYEHFLGEIKQHVKVPDLNEDDRPDTIRRMHHEFSGCFIHKYAMLFDFPSEEHTFAIAEISRGHRKTDLYDKEEYPAHMKLSNGNTLCLPYLSSLIRLADEIDVAADRNTTLLYDINDYTEECDIIAFHVHDAIKTLRIEPDSFTLCVQTDDPRMLEEVGVLMGKMQKTLDYCRRVTEELTSFRISQKEIKMEMIEG